MIQPMFRATRPHSHRPRLGRGVLVVEATGYTVRVSIAVPAGGGSARLTHTAQSSLSDPEAAAQEALSKLRGVSRRLPRDVVLLTAQAVSGVVELPVPPSQPRPTDQMQELVRWELEPVLAQSMAGRPIGTILVGRGHLTPRQATEVARSMGQPGGAGQPGPAQGGMRFGDTAVQLGLVDQAQVDACLRIQAWFQAGDDRYVCGWSPLSDEPASEGVWRWLVSAVSREARGVWAKAFRGLGLRLAGVYPVSGAAAGLGLEGLGVADAAGAGSARGVAVIELDPDQLTCTHVSKAGLLGYGYRQALTRADDTASRVAELCRAQACERVLLCGGAAEVSGLAEDLGELTGLPAAPAGLGELLPDPGVAGGAAFARHGAVALDLAASRGDRPLRLAGIAPTDPAPPVTRRPVAWWAAAACVLGALLIGNELRLRSGLDAARGELARLASEQRQVESHIEQTRAHNAQVESLERRLAQLDDADRRIDRQFRVFSDQLSRRVDWLPTLLGVLGEVTPEAVAIDRVVQTQDGALALTGWSLSQTTAEVFAGRLNERLAGVGVAVGSQSTERRAGRLGLAGYGFEMRLVEVGGAGPSPSVTGLAGGQR